MNDQLCTTCGSLRFDGGPCQVCGLTAELASARAEAGGLRDELSSIRGDMADWYEFGPPTDSTRRKATLLRDELSKCHAELDATRIDRDAVIRDYQSRLAEAFTDTGSVVMELEAARAEAQKLRDELSKCRAELASARAAAAGLRKMLSAGGLLPYEASDLQNVDAAHEALKTALDRLPDTCLLCGRKADSVFVIDALFKVAYGLCLTCSVKPGSHLRAFDAMISRMRAATIMSLSVE